MVERVLGIATAGTRPARATRRSPQAASPDEYERVQTPVYALLFGLAQATVGERRGGADPSARLWQMIGGGETAAARVRGWLLGSVAVPGAVGVANRLGLGPVRSDLSRRGDRPGRLRGDGRRGRADLAIDAEHVIFGHTHRRGGPRGPGGGGEALEHGQLGPLARPARRRRRREPLLAGDDLLRRRRRASPSCATCSTGSAATSSRTRLGWQGP